MTIEQIKQANKEAGQYFFSADTMRFFDSKIARRVYGNRYFITSEQFHGESEDGERLYTVREFDSKDGSVDTVGEFQQFASQKEAVKFIETLLKEEV